MKKGHGIRPTGLVPQYPDNFQCPPLTSLYASWIDIDGEKRDVIHSGVDGGRLGDWILAPAPGTVRAVWEANWGWGKEGALLLRHTRRDINLENGPTYFYSAFDHIDFDEIKHFKVGQKIDRGQRLARVSRPGGNPLYLPEVHWEVWEAQHDKLNWIVNRYNAKEWRNDSAELIDPLYMLGLHSRHPTKKNVQIVPFTPKANFKSFRGFTYILECQPL